MSNKKLNILTYMGESGPLTGAPRRLLTLVQGLRKLDVNVTVAAPKDSELFKIEESIGFSPIDVSPKGVLALKNRQLIKNKSFFFRLKIILELIKSNIEFYKKIKKQSFDLIWVRGSASFVKFGLAIILTRSKVIWDVDGELHSKGVVRLLHEIALFLSHKVIFQYEKSSRIMFSRILNKRYKIKYESLIPGIDVHCLTSSKERYNCKLKLIQVGTVCDNKNQAYTIRVLGALKERCPNLDFEVLFAGFIKCQIYQKKLEDLVDYFGFHGQVKFLGWRDDVTSLVASSDILLMPSLSEGVPNTIQEAMTLGIAVIGSTAGGIPEIIENNKTGYSIELEDFSAWLSTLEKLVCNTDFRTEIGHNAREYALQNFDNKAWVDKYHTVINELVKK